MLKKDKYMETLSAKTVFYSHFLTHQMVDDIAVSETGANK